ncbi:MAG: ATP-binding protein [Deltaproteobacteria bacterium]|nr:ATP-binding protein [Deltaproteobacteria bacterium]
MRNPFYFRTLPIDAAFCDREKELEELISHANNRANVTLISPRRYGKTSLVRRVQHALSNQGSATLYADFFGVTSGEEVAAKLASEVYRITHKQESLYDKAIRFFSLLRPVVRPDQESGYSITVEISKGKTGIELIEDAMTGLGKFAAGKNALCHIVFDEFQEIVELKDAYAIEGVMRSHIQNHSNASYFFVGSRRRILSDMFNDRKRPFYKSAVNYHLSPLPMDDLISFLIERFKSQGKSCSREISQKIYDLTMGYPYYAQKLAYHTFELTDTQAADKELHGAFLRLIEEEKPLFEAIIQGLGIRQISLLTALAKEPTQTPFAVDYMTRHNLGSVGAVQGAVKKLERLDYIERIDAVYRVVDPILAVWLKKREVIE